MHRENRLPLEIFEQNFTTNDFMAAGGDTYYAFASSANKFDTGIPLDEAVMAYITESLGGVVGEDYAAPKGRIHIIY